jgi:hypothetical protein
MRKHWLSRHLMLGLVAAALVVAGQLARAAPNGELMLEQELMGELNQVLKVGDSLHKSLVLQNEEQVELNLRDMLQQLERAKSACRLAKPHEQRHLVRILDGAHEQFELTQSAYGDERRSRLEEGYNQLVNLIRIYRVERTYSIFFCPKDKTTWIQRGTKPQNPFHPDAHREPCGMRVPR